MRLSRRQFIGLLGALSLSSCARMGLKIGGGDKGPFTIAAMNDLHVLNARSTAIVNKAIGQINGTPGLRFSVVLGDLSSTGKLGELNLAKKSLDRLSQPYFALPGNHDLEPAATDPYANFKQVFTSVSWTHEEGGWLFIGLDTCNGGESDVSVPADRISWLEKQLKGVKAERPIAMFTHHPFNPNTKEYRVKNADEVLGLFAQRNLRLVASGHWHGNQVEERNGILFTTTACCSSSRKNFDNTDVKGYRLFHLDNEKVATEFVAVGS